MIKRLADKLFRWFCDPMFYPDIKGDLEELHHLNSKQYSEKYANRKFLKEVILLVRPAIIKTLSKNSIIYNAMLRNYFKISIRNLLNHKAYSAINIIGLAIGLAAFLMISQYIRFERSYDKHLSNSDMLYRLTTDLIDGGVIKTRDAMSFHPSGQVLVDEMPEVLNYTTTNQLSEIVIRQNDEVRFEKRALAADSNFLKIFDYKILAGNLASTLNDPYNIVLTESKAKAYFGDGAAVGQSLELLGDFNRRFNVTAVIEDVPENTHYKFDILISLKSIQRRLDDDGWNGFNYYTYLKIDRQADMASLRSKLPTLSRKYIGEDSKLTFNLQPVEVIHLESNFTYEPEIHGSADAVNFLVIIAIFVLIIAWVNYINLSTARAIDRAKEVGLRKVIGAQKRQLIIQFMFESLIINFIGALIALVIAELSLPFFNQLIDKEIADHVWNDVTFLRTLTIFFLAGTIVTGSYPAFVLSKFTPVVVLKGKFRNSKDGVILRKGLVILQFTVSLVMIAGTLIVSKQMNYMRSKDKGFDINQTIGFRNPSAAQDEREASREKLLSFYDVLRSQSSIQAVGSTSNMPGGGSSDINSSSGGVKIVGLTDVLQATTYIQAFDQEFIKTMGMEILEGRTFNHDFAQDTAAIIVNTAFLDRFGISDYESILDEKIQFGLDPENRKRTIVGVLKNFNRTSLKSNIEPSCYLMNPASRYSVVKLNTSNSKEAIDQLDETWRRFFPNAPLDLVFLDQRFEQLYKEEKRFGSVFGSFSILAICVAMLGLFGLSSFMAIQRTKEVGVRKVLGASVVQIIGIFYKDFVALFGISSLVGIPSVYFVMNGWLGDYAYRIDFPWLLTFSALLLVVVFALVTVGLQTRKVAILNPAKSLKYE